MTDDRPLATSRVAGAARDRRDSTSAETESQGVVDLFSGAGGMSWGFHAQSGFTISAAVDAEIGKPTDIGLGCNETYAKNIGIEPIRADLGSLTPSELKDIVNRSGKPKPAVLTACPPCTGFSRTVPRNQTHDDPRNSLVSKVADFAEALEPQIVVVENAREMLKGKFRQHGERLIRQLSELGYQIVAESYRLDRFGLPQRRDRSIVIASRTSHGVLSLPDLWGSWRVDNKATHVRRAIWDLPEIGQGTSSKADPIHQSARSFGIVEERLRAIPADGGSWIDLFKDARTLKLATPAMIRAVESGNANHFSDVYGRMRWDAPAPVVKRECSHVGNGRYTHPAQHRLVSVREMALLQGFPRDYWFDVTRRKNAYRHIGDAVPPLISFQLAAVCKWMLDGKKPNKEDIVLPNSTLAASDIHPDGTAQTTDVQAAIS